MTTSWPSIELGQIADVAMGQSPPGDTYNDKEDGLPFFQDKADFGRRFPTVRKWCSKPSRVAEADDILLSVRAPVGPINVARERSCIGRGLAAIRAREDRVEQGYLRLFFAHQEGVLALRGQGSTFSAINRRDIEKLLVPWPPPSEQRRIVEILDQVDEICGLRAKVDSNGDRIINALLTRTLGNPTNWHSESRSMPLGDLVKVVGGATPTRSISRFWSGDIPWVSPKDMKRDFVSVSRDHVTRAALNETNLREIQQGSVLIVVRGMILARDVPVALNEHPVTINQDMKALLPKLEQVNSTYIWAALRLAKQQLRLLVRIAGHGTRKLDTPDLMQFSIPSPSLRRVTEVDHAVEHHRMMLRLRQQRADLMERLHMVSLSKAFDGSLTSAWRAARLKELLQEVKHRVKVLHADGQRY